jgi:hypothetical protein
MRWRGEREEEHNTAKAPKGQKIKTLQTHSSPLPLNPSATFSSFYPAKFDISLWITYIYVCIFNC